MIVLTVGTNICRLRGLLESCARFGATPVTAGLGVDVPYKNNIAKLKLYHRALRDCNQSDEAVLFVDGYDTRLLCPPEEILEKYGGGWVFAGQRVCWPHYNLAQHHPDLGECRFLNSGCWIGRAEEAFHWIDLWLRKYYSETDDQGLFTRAYLDHPGVISIDHRCDLFQCVLGEPLEVTGGRIRNARTGALPCVLHGPGNPKDEFFRLCGRLP